MEPSRRLPPALRGLAALLCALLALGPVRSAAAAPARTAVLPVPYAALPGAPEDFTGKVFAQIVSELRTREELRLLDLPEVKQDARAAQARARSGAEKAASQARDAFGKAAALAKKGKHAQAAAALRKAIEKLRANPLALDEAGAKLLADATLQLAVSAVLSGDGDGTDLALEALVRLSPERQLTAADYPPAFLRAFEAARARVLAAPRASVRVLAPAGPGELRVMLDGRPLRAAPLRIAELPPGEHVLRAWRGGAIWAETLEVAPGAELTVLPQPSGEGGAAADLRAALAKGQLDRAGAARAARLAKAAGAQAALIGAIAREKDGFAVRSFLVLVKGEKIVQLAPMALDPEMLGASLQMLRLADDVVARLLAPPAPPALPVALGSSAPAAEPDDLPSVRAAPPAPPGAQAPPPPATASNELELPAAEDAASTSEAPRKSAATSAAPAVAVAPAAEPPPRTVAMPGSLDAAVAQAGLKAGAPAEPATPGAPPKSEPPQATAPTAEPPRAAPPAESAAKDDGTVATASPPRGAAEPSRKLVVPRRPTRDDDAPDSSAGKARPAPPAAVHMEALEASQVATVREQPAKKNHTALWIIAGVLVAGGLGVGGYLLYENGRSPTSATVSASWGH